MHILFPGRHHLNTQFQFDYLLEEIEEALHGGQPVESVIFPITSANHSQTRRNPLPLFQRAMALHDFASELPVPGFIFPIDDVGVLDNFAAYVLKRIRSQSGNRFHLTPANTRVLCSTPSVISMYRGEGFEILPAELVSEESESEEYRAVLPWELLEEMVGSSTGDAVFEELAHPSTKRLWRDYGLKEKVRMLFQDGLLGDDGDLTETRDYNSYVRQMDENIDFKYMETRPHLKEGRIGDIGCAVGSWIKKVAEEPEFRESDFYGIEVSRRLLEICEHRKSLGEFANPNVFFSRRNAVLDCVFPVNSMQTIHTSSLTHEIFSYVSLPDDASLEGESLALSLGEEQLRAFIQNRYAELDDGGVWVNRDVVGPEDGSRDVLLEHFK